MYQHAGVVRRIKNALMRKKLVHQSLSFVSCGVCGAFSLLAPER